MGSGSSRLWPAAPSWPREFSPNEKATPARVGLELDENATANEVA